MKIHAWIKVAKISLQEMRAEVERTERHYRQKVDQIILDFEGIHCREELLSAAISTLKSLDKPLYIKAEEIEFSIWEQWRSLGVSGVVLCDALLQNPMLSEEIFERWQTEWVSAWVESRTSDAGRFVLLQEGRQSSQKRFEAWLTQLEQLAVRQVFIVAEEPLKEISMLKYASAAVSVPVVAVLANLSSERVIRVATQTKVPAILIGVRE